MTANDVPDYSISRLHARDDLADVVALEAASFSNPWSRDTLERDLRNTDVVRVYVLRDGDRRLVGFCGCWFVADELHIMVKGRMVYRASPAVFRAEEETIRSRFLTV